MTPVLRVKGENRPPFRRYSLFSSSAATATGCRPATRRLPEDTASAPMTINGAIGAALRLGFLVLMVVSDSSKEAACCWMTVRVARLRVPPAGSWLVPMEVGAPDTLDLGFRFQLTRNLP
jgi:hypothetical protein